MKHVSAAAFANRAMVRLKRDDWKGAEEDCGAALELDSLYLKAWQRRGTCRRNLKDYLGAAQDFEEALRSLQEQLPPQYHSTKPAPCPFGFNASSFYLKL